MIISLIGTQSDRQDAICFICVSSPLFGEAGFGFPGSIPGPATKYPVREKATPYLWSQLMWKFFLK